MQAVNTDAGSLRKCRATPEGTPGIHRWSARIAVVEAEIMVAEVEQRGAGAEPGMAHRFAHQIQRWPGTRFPAARFSHKSAHAGQKSAHGIATEP